MTLTKYDEIMNRLEMSDEMRERVLANVDNAPARRFKAVRIERILIPAACFVVLLVGALAMPTLLPSQVFDKGELQQETQSSSSAHDESAQGQETSQSAARDKSGEAAVDGKGSSQGASETASNEAASAEPAAAEEVANGAPAASAAYEGEASQSAIVFEFVDSVTIEGAASNDDTAFTAPAPAYDAAATEYVAGQVTPSSTQYAAEPGNHANEKGSNPTQVSANQETPAHIENTSENETGNLGDNDSPQGNPSTNNGSNIDDAGNVVNAKDAKALSDMAGLPITDIPSLASDSQSTSYQLYGDGVAEIEYQLKKNTVWYRASDDGNVPSDSGEFTETSSVRHDGVAITIAGDEGACSAATWNRADVAYEITTSSPVEKKTIREYAETAIDELGQAKRS